MKRIQRPPPRSRRSSVNFTLATAFAILLTCAFYFVLTSSLALPASLRTTSAFHSIFNSVTANVPPSTFTFIPTHIPDLPPTLDRYISWHNTHTRCIADPSCVQARPPVLVWRCLDRSIRTCAGVGDRVRGIQVALMVAILTRRLFYLQWPDDPYPFTDAISPNALDWRFPSSSLSHTSWPLLNWFLCPYNRTRRTCRRPMMLIPSDDHLPNVLYSMPTINASSDDLQAHLSVVSDMAIACRIPASLIEKFVSNPSVTSTMPDLHPSRLPSLTLQRLLIQMLFRPSPSVQSVIDTVAPPAFVNAGYVGVHARTGLDFRENNTRFVYFKQNFTGAVHELINCAHRLHPLASSRMFITTDSVLFKTTLARIVNENGVETRFINGSKAFHFGLRYSEKLLRRVSEVARWQAYINVFADLYMLANSRAIVTTGSGFADVAFSFGNASRLVVAPAGNGTELCGSLMT